jgi:hypothetical protein
MGQPLPLPERIPVPNSKTSQALTDCGVVVNGQPNCLYVTYTLPENWKMIDNSDRVDIPVWYIVDANNLARFQIAGAWKGVYDNELSIRIVESPYLVKPRSEEPTPSETSNTNLALKFVTL